MHDRTTGRHFELQLFFSAASRKWKRSRSRGPLSAITIYMAPRWCMAARASGMIGACSSTRSARASNTAASRSDMRPGPYWTSNFAQTVPPHRCLRCANHALRNFLGSRMVTSFDLYHACCHSLMTSPKTSGASCCGKRDSAPCSCSSLCLRTHKGRSNMRMTAITGGSSPCWDGFVGSNSSLKTASRIACTCGCTSAYRRRKLVIFWTWCRARSKSWSTTSHMTQSHVTTSHFTHHKPKEENTKKKFLGRVLGPDEPDRRNLTTSHITHHGISPDIRHHISPHHTLQAERREHREEVLGPSSWAGWLTTPHQASQAESTKKYEFYCENLVRTIRDQRKVR